MVIFFDIDGTIVDDGSQIIPQSTLRAIAQLGQRGHIPVINTGRPYSHIDPRVRAMPFAGWVCGCGMEIRLNGEWLQRLQMPPQLCREVVEAVRQHQMQVLYEVEGGLVLDGHLSSVQPCTQEASRMAQKGFTLAQVADCEDLQIIKFVTFDGPGSEHEAFVEKMQPHFTCIDRGGGMVEYVRKGCSKALGMQLLLNALGAGKVDTMAFGDSTNDIPMFLAAGQAVCMGGGMAQAKAAATYVTDAVLDDGIENALKHFNLI